MYGETLKDARLSYAPRDAVEPQGKVPAWLAHVMVTLGVVTIFAYDLHIILPRFVRFVDHHHAMRLFVYPSLLWMVMGALLLVFRTVVWFFYRPFPAVAADSAPFMTIVIPAYNEGSMVRQSIVSAAEADYPRGRREILVIDDGSTDDTWMHIQAAAARYPGLVTALRHDRNRGKRAALSLGFERARGELIVSLDSDSVIERGALLALAGPFRNPRVGAVAGKVLVFNRQGLIPRMLHARYIMSFDFLRAVESAYGNVFCCPGALTALRAAAIRPLIARWRTQTFLGAPCTIGEDRAMTNDLLNAGYDTVYQSSAVVRTVAPQKFGQLCKMLLRWDRSYVREEIRFARILWKRPLKTRAIAFLDRFVTNLRYPVFYASLVLLGAMIVSDPWTVARMLVTVGFFSFCNMIYFMRSERSFEFLWGVVYAYFAIFALSWIFPYAVATVRKPGWLTR
jgi:hyaluronan synthase